MNRIVQILGVLLVLALLAGLGAAAYYTVVYLVDVFTGLETQIKDTMVALWIGVIVASLIVGGSVRWARRRETQDRLRLEKAAVYRQFLDAWGARLHGGLGTGNGAFDREAAFATAERALLVWGSVAVLQHYGRFKDVAAEDGPASLEAQQALDDLLRAMRADLGQRTFGLSQGELSTLMLEASGGDLSPSDRRYSTAP